MLRRCTRRGLLHAQRRSQASAVDVKSDDPETHPLRPYVDSKYQLWGTLHQEPKELPTTESMSQVLLKIRFFTRLLGTADEEEAARLKEVIADLKQRAKRWNFPESRYTPDDRNAEADKASLNVLLRFGLRFGSLTQMTYDWLLADFLKVYGNRALDGAVIVTLLKRSGLMDPEENMILTANQRSLVPPEWLSRTTCDSDQIPDDCAEIREEFPLRCFAIDDPSTFEVDDAISYDEATGYYSVHVADVSRYLPYQSDVRNTAQLLSTTVYFPETVLTMLPRAIIDVATLKAAPAESLMVSVRFRINDDDGTVTDQDVFVARTTNCVRITYEQLNSILPIEYADDAEGALGRPRKDVEMPDWFDADKDTAALTKIFTTARMLRRKRTERGALMIVRPEWWPKLSKPEQGDEEAEPEEKGAQQRHGWDIDVQLRANVAFDSRKLVEEFMLLAGHSVAEVCLREQIPCAFRVTPMDLSLNPDYASLPVFPSSTKRLRRPDPEADVPPVAQYEQGTNKLKDQKSAFYSSICIGHAALRTSYAHFTSPLRRYPDLLVHYHVKDWLLSRHRKATGDTTEVDEAEREVVSEILRKTLPNVCQRVSNTTNSKKKMMKNVKESWLVTDIQRKLAEDPARLFDAYVGATYDVSSSIEHNSNRGSHPQCSTIVLSDYGLLFRAYHDGEYAEGMMIKTRIPSVEPQTRLVVLELLPPAAAK